MALISIDESENSFDDLSLLSARKLPHFFECTLHFTDRSWPIGQDALLLGNKQILELDTERFGEPRKNIAARCRVAPLPSGDRGLRHVDRFGELGLRQPGVLSQLDEMSALLRSRSNASWAFRHERTVARDLGIDVRWSSLRLHQ